MTLDTPAAARAALNHDITTLCDLIRRRTDTALGRPTDWGDVERLRRIADELREVAEL